MIADDLKDAIQQVQHYFSAYRDCLPACNKILLKHESIIITTQTTTGNQKPSGIKSLVHFLTFLHAYIFAENMNKMMYLLSNFESLWVNTAVDNFSHFIFSIQDLNPKMRVNSKQKHIGKPQKHILHVSACVHSCGLGRCVYVLLTGWWWRR